jgi:acetyl esterase
MQLRLGGPAGDASHLTLASVRRAWQLCVKAFATRRKVAAVRQLAIRSGDRELTLKVYVGSPGHRPRPAVVWFHGGGFVFGDLYTAGATCRAIASRTGASVVAVDYGLVPENSLERARADCLAAAVWVFEHSAEIDADPERIVLGGDSAGGTLAALVAHELQRSAFRPAAQVLLYPATDLQAKHVSLDDAVPILTSGHIAWIRRQIASVSDDADPRLSPLRQPDFGGLPMTIMVTAGFDPLRDEGLAYARRLASAGVPVRLLHYPGQFHGFMSFDRVLVGAGDALDRVCDMLVGALRTMVLAPGVESVSVPLSKALRRPLWLRPSQRWNELVVTYLLLKSFRKTRQPATPGTWSSGT